MNLAELGLRAARCPRWKWMPGMRLLVGSGRAPYRYVTNEYAPPEGEDVGFSDPIVPDLSDPATLGCLLHLVREAYGDLSLQPNDAGEYDMLHWHVFIGPHFACTGHATEAEALVVALEAAP